MPRRVLQFLLLTLLLIQSPTLRACGVERLLTGVNCHDAASRFVHCDDASFGQASDAREDRPPCQSCLVRPVTMEQGARSSVPALDLLPVSLPPALVLPTPAAADPHGRPLACFAAAPSVARVLPLLI